ncbi:MAG: alpha-2-macroglobulin family protein [Anaerolineales bacterium]
MTKRMESIKRFGMIFLAVVMLAGNMLACTLPGQESNGSSTLQPIPIEDNNTFVPEQGEPMMNGGGDKPGLSIRLSDGQSIPSVIERLVPVLGESLTQDEIDDILARLTPWVVDQGLEVDFRLPEAVLPPPLTGDTIPETFPTSTELEGPRPVYGKELEVLRFAPEGDVAIAPFISVTFNQPMVALNTLEALAEEDVPVQVTPLIPGTWRWLGTKTLNFNADSELYDRLPMATEFLVTIPAGVESAVGKTLKETVQFRFSTPPTSIEGYYPSNSPQPLEPMFFISFDQRIDPSAVLANLEVTAGNNPVQVKLATKDEIKDDKTLSSRIEYTGDGRWMAFRVLEPLPPDTSIVVRVKQGTPSAEGPLVTLQDQTYSFHTYAPLKIVEHGCSWGGDDCRPLTPIYIRFNNPIDLDSYDETMLRIEPELPNASVNIYGNTINISGNTQGRTTYWVTVDGTIQDIFGQTLGKDNRLKFKIGSADPVLFGPDEIFVTLDPADENPALSLFTMNYNKLNVEIYSVVPSDWPDFIQYLRDFQRTDLALSPPGKKVWDGSLPIESPADKLTEVYIPIAEHMIGKSGQFVVIAKPPKGLFQEDRYWETVQVWVQVTQIGLDAFVDHSEMVVWATDLKTGAPIPGVEIRTDSGNLIVDTNHKGVGRFDIPPAGISYLVAEQGDDLAFLPPSTYYWNDGGWSKRSLSDELRWYVWDDRQMYKPGEEVYIKGWMRRIGTDESGDVELVGDQVNQVTYQVIGPQGNELVSGQAEVNPLGGFDFHFSIPENANLGYTQLILHPVGTMAGISYTNHYHNIQVQEFRRPEFEVTARNETTGPYFVGDQAMLAVEAKYYAGGPLPNAETNWYVMSSPTNYQPPNWSDFTFGYWTPWWFYDYYYNGDSGSAGDSFSGTTDASGNHYLRLGFDSMENPRSYSVIAEATVFDVNRQAWTGSTSLMVHPANLYVGLRSQRYFVQQGQPLEVDLIVTDLDGSAVEDRPIKVTAARLEWKYKDGRWQEVEVGVQDCTIGSKLEPVSCEFETPVGGRYQITAVITDSEGRQNQSSFTRWVSGGQRPPSRDVEQEQVTLIPDQEIYQPGDVAEILVEAPFSNGEGLLTISRNGIISTKSFTMDGSSYTLRIPIKEVYIPNLNIQVDVVGSVPRTDDTGEILEGAPSRPAFASGQLNLSIPPLERTLDLQVDPRETELEPGGYTWLDVVVRDASGEPVADVELAVVIVDEAVLGLTNYNLSDPLSVFYATRPSDYSSYYTRSSIVLTNPVALLDQAVDAARNMPQSTLIMEGVAEMEEAAPAMDALFAGEDKGMGGGEAPGTAIQIRIDFNPLAIFAPEVHTNSNGRAAVKVNLPDNLTRYRVMVVAVDDSGKQFGSGEVSLTARLPLMVRPSAPRFLNFGDQFEMPVVLQNQTDEALETEIIIQASNLELDGDIGMRVSIPARDRIEVRFPMSADMAGTAKFRVAAVSGDFSDAAAGELPVYTPATTESFATYGVISQGAIVQPVAKPEDVFPQFGGLQINTSSTALQALTDAVIYLYSYPYECSEQMASRILGIAALRDVLTAFEADGLPSTEAMEDSVTRDLELLGVIQNYDGGFPYWRRGQDSIPFNTIHVAHSLARAKQKGFEVPENMWANASSYLRDIEQHYPYWYSEYTRNSLSAYALYVRDLMGDPDPNKARNLFHDAGFEKISITGIGWIWQVLVDDSASLTELTEIRKWVANRVVETPGAANFTTYYDDQSYLLLSSDRKTDAVLLDTLIADDPESDLIPKLVNGLLAHQRRGRWKNTQENVFVLLALDRYFNTYEAQEPEFVARIWLGDTYAGEHEYVGYSTERHLTEIPMSYLMDTDQETQDLTLNKIGPGRLYYRLGLKYAPTDLKLDPLEMGFVVLRVYEAVDDPEDVTQREDGTWVIKAGARVRIRLTMVADNRRYHVALIDPLPAGLEIINPALAVSGSIPQDPNSSDYRFGWWWWWPWYEHQNMRDERAEAFTSLLWEGVFEYTYVARATTPGVFVVPPAKAEEMYSPEVFGRSGSDIVIVE